LEKIDTECVDMIITSPPYSNLRHYGNTLTEWNHDKFKEIANELNRVIKHGGVIVWVVGDKTEKGSETCVPFKQVLYFRDIGLNLNDTMLWEKTNPLPQVKQPRYRDCFEYMFVFSKGKPKTFNPIMRKCVESGKHYKSTVRVINTDNDRKDIDYFVSDETVDYNIWKMSVAQNKILYDVNGKKIKHPAVFPYDIPYKHIKTWTNEGDLVLDPFMGSGTTALAAIDLKRNFIGIDMNEEYCKIAEIRINENNNNYI
jgi:site-specific DNA-methyltransferase (adenine-specific)